MSIPTALVADDEPLLRERLAVLLASAWPELRVVAQARNGMEAVDLWEEHRPDVAFLDVHMPGRNGVEAARMIGPECAIVFVTAFDQYAVDAFARGAVDYLLKPVEAARLDETVQRLREKLRLRAHPADWTATLDEVAAQLRDRLGERPQRLQWIKASVGNAVRIIPVDQVVYLKSDHKYTLVVWEGGEALIRKTIRELADELDPERFAQIHRSAIVNLAQVTHFVHAKEDSGEVTLRGRPEKLAVSRSYLHLFQRM